MKSTLQKQNSLDPFICRYYKHHTLNMIPNQQPVLFAATLAQICVRENIDVLIPTCEEIFWVSKGKDMINRDAPHTHIFVAGPDVMRSLHNKWLFNQSLNISTPTDKESNQLFAQCETELLRDTTQIIHFVEGLLQKHENESPDERIDIVLKPVYSRFAAQTLVRPSLNELRNFTKELQNEQRYVHMISRKNHQVR
jgi:hypothetical protein